MKSTPALRKALERLYRDTTALLPVDVFLVGLADPSGERLEIRTLLVDGGEVHRQELRLSPEAALTGLIRRRESGILRPVVAAELLGEEWPDGGALVGVAPLEEAAVVACQEVRDGSYEPHHPALAALVARQAALLIERDRLIRTQEEMRREMRPGEEQLDELAQRLIALEEHQREAWATDVHNSLAPLIFTSAMHLEAFLDGLEGQAVEAELAHRALNQIRRAGQEIRRLIASVGPTSLDVRGVGRVIQDMARSYASQEGWELSVVDRLGTRAISGAVSNALYRIAEEALSNVRDHAQASRVDIRLEMADSEIVLLIRDDGRGLPESGALEPGVGVFGMRRRLDRLGGKLRIGRAPGGGLELEASIPLPAKAGRSPS